MRSYLSASSFGSRPGRPREDAPRTRRARCWRRVAADEPQLHPQARCARANSLRSCKIAVLARSARDAPAEAPTRPASSGIIVASQPHRIPDDLENASVTNEISDARLQGTGCRHQRPGLPAPQHRSIAFHRAREQAVMIHRVGITRDVRISTLFEERFGAPL